ncbi:MAG: hypothetical protein ACD_56C00058G0001 [uncultured bacterium]|nr:MAG: hypothetical protein ACD_56C00058G0001 [uncultured bacterium]
MQPKIASSASSILFRNSEGLQTGAGGGGAMYATGVSVTILLETTTALTSTSNAYPMKAVELPITAPTDKEPAALSLAPPEMSDEAAPDPMANPETEGFFRVL